MICLIVKNELASYHLFQVNCKKKFILCFFLTKTRNNFQTNHVNMEKLVNFGLSMFVDGFIL